MHTQETPQTVTSAAATAGVVVIASALAKVDYALINLINTTSPIQLHIPHTLRLLARDWVATSALAMRPPEDLSKITPSEPTWRARSAV